MAESTKVDFAVTARHFNGGLFQWRDGPIEAPRRRVAYHGRRRTAGAGARSANLMERPEVEDGAHPWAPGEAILPDADATLVEQIRAANAEACQRFVRQHYGAI